MTHIISRYDGDILVISIREAKILDELLIRQIQMELLRALETSQATRVLLDFGIVSFLSSSALGMLIRCKKKSNDFKLWLKLCSIDREIRKLFRITGLNKVFEIHRDELDALIAFRQGNGPGQAGVFAKLKPRSSGDAAEAEPEAEEPQHRRPARENTTNEGCCLDTGFDPSNSASGGFPQPRRGGI